MRFALALKSDDDSKFHDLKRQEIVPSRRLEGSFELAFSFVDATVAESGPAQVDRSDFALTQADSPETGQSSPAPGTGMVIPEYVMVEEAA